MPSPLTPARPGTWNSLPVSSAVPVVISCGRPCDELVDVDFLVRVPRHQPVFGGPERPAVEAHEQAVPGPDHVARSAALRPAGMNAFDLSGRGVVEVHLRVAGVVVGGHPRLVMNAMCGPSGETLIRSICLSRLEASRRTEPRRPATRRGFVCSAHRGRRRAARVSRSRFPRFRFAIRGSNTVFCRPEDHPDVAFLRSSCRPHSCRCCRAGLPLSEMRVSAGSAGSGRGFAPHVEVPTGVGVVRGHLLLGREEDLRAVGRSSLCIRPRPRSRSCPWRRRSVCTARRLR